jgi:predicted metalloendopeptidase
MTIKTKRHNKINNNKKSKKVINTNCNINLPGYSSFEENYNIPPNTSEIVNFFNSRNTSESKKLRVNDFYTYMCKNSIDNLKLNESQKYINNITSNTLLQDKIYRQCIELVESHTDSNLKKFYESSKKYTSLNVARKYLNEEIHIVDNLRLDTINNNLWKLLAHRNQTRINGALTPLFYQLKPDEKETTRFKVYLTNEWISTWRNYKLDNKRNLYEFNYYINNVCTELLGKNHGISSEDIIQVHNDIYECINPQNTTYDYTLVCKNDAQKYNFNYTVFFTELGYTDETMPDNIIIKDIMYFEKICKLMITNWNTPKWRSFWLFTYINQLTRFTEKIHIYSFNFFIKHYKKWDYDFPDDIRGIRFTLLVYNKLLSELYIEKYNDKSGILYLTTLINDLKMTFYKQIQKNTWMNSKTRQRALLNIENLKIIVGQTLNVIDDVVNNYTDDDIWKNMQLYLSSKHKFFLRNNNKNVINYTKMVYYTFPFEYTGTNMFIASIKYFRESNFIYIPSAYIQQPNMDLRSKGMLYNLSHIGFNIAKEFNTVIDDNGSRYNSYGMLEDWWTSSDKIKYKSLKQNIINEYILLAKKDKIEVNITGLENIIISFINGFNLCDAYLHTYYNHINLPYVITDSKLSSFYSYFSNCNKEKILHYPILDCIPMLSFKYLVNLSLSKNIMFNYKYGIKKGDNMYIENKEIIW